MRFKLKRFIQSTLFVIAITGSNGAWAVATADAPNLGAQIHENIQSSIDWGKEKAMMMADMDLKSLLSKLGIDNLNNAFANLIARSGAALQNIQNLEILESMMPDVNLCGNVSYSLYTDEIGCAVEDEAYSTAYRQSVDQTMFSMVGEDYGRFVTHKAKKLVNECSLLTTANIDNPEITQQEALQYSECFQVGKIFGSGVGSETLTAVESEALNNAIEIMVDPIPSEKRSGKMIPGTDSYNRAVLEESRTSLAKIMALTSLQEIKSWRTGPVGQSGKVQPGKMAVLDEFIAQFDAAWAARIGGGTIKGSGNPDNIAYPSELMRQSLVISQWSAELQLHQFKQQLRQEGLIAMQLALMTEGN